ncbi:hypothetical protein HDU76_005348, partial [Blyttiomyces sp. JEL0837]
VELDGEIDTNSPLPADPTSQDESLSKWLDEYKSVIGASTVSVGQVFTARKSVDNDGDGTYFWLQSKSKKIGMTALSVFNVRNDNERVLKIDEIIVCIWKRPSRLDRFSIWQNRKTFSSMDEDFIEVKLRIELINERRTFIENHKTESTFQTYIEDSEFGKKPIPIFDLAFFDHPGGEYENIPGLEISANSFSDNETVAFCGYSCIEQVIVDSVLNDQYSETVNVELLPKADLLLHEGLEMKVVRSGNITTLLGTMEIQAVGGPFLDSYGHVKETVPASYPFESEAPVSKSDDDNVPKSRNRNLSLCFKNPGVRVLLEKAYIL